MGLEKWAEYGWLRREPTSPSEIEGLLGIVERSLADARVEAVSTDLRFIAAFNVALCVATTALRASGHRIATQAGHQVKTIDSLELTIKASPKPIQRFKTFNNKRNKSVYHVAGAISDQELEAMMKLANELKDSTVAWLQEFHQELLEIWSRRFIQTPLHEQFSPRECSEFCVRECTCRAVRAEQRNANRLAGAFLDSLRARIVVEVRLGEAWRDGVDVDPGRLQLDCHGERHSVESRLGRRVDGAEDRAPGGSRVRVHRQRANATRHIDDASCRRLAQERQHRLVNGENAEHVRLPYRAHFID